MIQRQPEPESPFAHVQMPASVREKTLMLGKLCADRRAELGLSTIRLANKARVRKSVLQAFENGNAKMSEPVLDRLMRALELDQDDFARSLAAYAGSCPGRGWYR